MTTTRGVRPEIPSMQAAGVGSGKGGLLPPPSPAPAFHLHAQRLRGIGQICLACGEAIYTAGWRLHRAELMETHAHAACLDAVMTLLIARR